MGSRAIVIICKDEKTAIKRFGVEDEGIGIVYTRTGRRFFNEPEIEIAFLKRIAKAIELSDFWNEFKTDWVCLDCELMPWSQKAQELIKSQYASVGTAANVSLSDAIKTLEISALRLDLQKGYTLSPDSSSTEFDIEKMINKFINRKVHIDHYIDAYRKYCWTVHSIDDLKLAPFHILATEGYVHSDKDHEWHIKAITKICSFDPKLMIPTPYRMVNLTDNESIKASTNWWEDLTNSGNEGIVVKPFSFIIRGKKGLLQPAIKCRGREYLRIIYGPEYIDDQNLERLKKRWVGTKRSLALKEFVLGIEALERFVRKEPLRRIHECVFGILALESEPVDPRL